MMKLHTHYTAAVGAFKPANMSSIFFILYLLYMQISLFTPSSVWLHVWRGDVIKAALKSNSEC